MKGKMLLGLGNLYVETNYLGVESSGADNLLLGHEYSAPKYEIRLGGSAVNFITQAKRFDLEVGIIGKCGDDKSADVLFEMFNKEGVSTNLIKRSSSVQTNVDTGVVFAHNGQNIQIVAGNANQSLSVSDIDLKSPVFDNVEAVYFGGSFKQKLLWPNYPEIFKTLYDKGIKLYIDPGRVPVDADDRWLNILKDIMPMVSGYFPNDMEILSVTNQTDINISMEKVMSWGPKMVVVKMGRNGCLVATNNERFSSSAHKVDVVNTVGAGDCFNAAFIARLMKGEALIEAAKFANAAAAIRVSKNFQPSTNEVYEYLGK